MKPACQRTGAKAGFTLIEILMVVVIILITSGIAAVSFSQSFKGMKLRLGTRAVIMAGRYARSLAVLHQTETAVLLDSELSTIETVMIRSSKKRSDESMFMDTTDDEAEANYTIEKKLARKLDGVKIISVDASAESSVQEIDGIYWITYYPNGRCEAYEVVLQDEAGKSVHIEVDPLSGRAKTKD